MNLAASPVVRRPRTVARFVAVGLLALCSATAVSFADAQTVTARKPAPRLPANASEQSRIPAGVDTGTPATSDTLPLGTPVPPSATQDRGESRYRSAAARAATRRTTSDGPLAKNVSCNPGAASSTPSADAVALPGSGFTGQSATPAQRAAVATKPVKVAC